MKKKSFITAVALLFASALVAGGIHFYRSRMASLPYFSKGTFTYEKQEAKVVSTFSFTNQEGQVMNSEKIQNSVWVVNYFFTRCGSICPIMTKNIFEVQTAFSDEDHVKIISISCDPEFDQVPQLANYAKTYKVNSNKWQMLTGDKKNLYQFARNSLQLAATESNSESNDFIHSPYCVLIDKAGYIRGYYDATEKSSINQLIIDIKKLL